MSLPYQRALLFTPSTPITIAKRFEILTTDFLIAIDGGLDCCRKLGLTPHLLIGDMDSLDKPDEVNTAIYAQTVVVRYPHEKNETDTQLAVQYCLEHKLRRIIIFNDLQGRCDHALALMQNLQEANRQGCQAEVWSENQRAFILNKRNVLQYPAGSLLSIIPLTSTLSLKRSSGLKWALDNLRLCQWQSRAISNELLSETAEIVVAGGIGLAIVTCPVVPDHNCID